MQETQTWRALLGTIISDSQERQRIANELGMNPMTLIRWANNETKPRVQNLQQLLRAIPAKYRESMTNLLIVEFPDMARLIQDPLDEKSLQEIPSAFYTSVLRAHATTVKQQRFWSISNLILQQALGQLDSNLLGMEITIAQCMPPAHGSKVRSLRERTGRGTRPWNTNIEQRSLFLGIESLAGYALTSQRLMTIQDRNESQIQFTERWTEFEESAAACPIIFQGRLAGCLLVSSTQPHYFLPFRLQLIQNYADLLVLAFEADEFYAPEDIELLPMPSLEEQQAYIAQLRQRISEVMLESYKAGRSINVMDAERIVWQRLEDELLQLPLKSE
ncbi:MAG TPA: GAF domain-containing protein [Ktedonobacteraceae bacterium]|jgi:transcriptional regulator with XRE-family HTH domain|nr:GAF domain-containing protein [Ktedonobacteraceae bacterium]